MSPTDQIAQALAQLQGGQTQYTPQQAQMQAAASGYQDPATLAQLQMPPTNPQPMPGQVPTPNPFQLNAPLEAQAQTQGLRPETSPIVMAMMQHMGLLNMIRNRGNEQVIDPEQQVQQ